MRKLWSSYYTLSSNFLLIPEKIWKSFDCPNLIGGFLCVCVLKNVSLPSLFCNNSFFCFVHMFLSLFELYSFFVFCQHAFCFSRYACCFSNAYFCLTGMNIASSPKISPFLHSYVLWHETLHFLPQLALCCDCVRCYWRKKKWSIISENRKKHSTEKFGRIDLVLIIMFIASVNSVVVNILRL